MTLNRRTQEAAAALLGNPVWQGKTVVMVWEHDHIADAKLEKKFPGEAVTLRQLLHLDTLAGDLAERQLRLFLYRRLRPGLGHADRLPHGEANVRRRLL